MSTDNGTPSPAARHLVGLEEALQRRIRALRGPTREWTLRTSELFATAGRRVLSGRLVEEEDVPAAQFIRYFDRVVRNAVIDRIRRLINERKARTSLREHRRQPTPEEQAVRIELLDQAHAFLAQLTEEDVRLIDAWTRTSNWREAAHMLGVPETTARQQWAALRRTAAGPPAPPLG